MYNQNSLATGAKWFFCLAIIVMVMTFAFGFNVKNATWLNREIASATADQMIAANEVDREKAELDLQILRTQTEIQIAQQKQQAEFEAVKQQQELQALNQAIAQSTRFRENLFNVFIFGLILLMVAIGLVVMLIGIYVGRGLNRLLNMRAQKIQTLQPAEVRANRRQPSYAAQQARQREREQRERDIKILADRISRYFQDSEEVWPDDKRKSGTRQPGTYPRAM